MAATLHRCALCGRRQSAEKMIYSRHTGARYCTGADIDACTRRARRLQKEG